MIQLHRSTTLLASALALLALPGLASADDVQITPTVTFDGSLYTYHYSVVNNAPETLAIVSFATYPLPDALTLDPTTFPTGFDIAFDPGVGLVSFLEDSDPNTPGAFDPGTTVSGFTFTSAFAPNGSPFEALDVAGNTFTGTTLAPNATPEPGVSALGAALVFGLGFATRRRSRKASA